MKENTAYIYQREPLSETFMIMSMVGTIIFGAYTLFGRIDLTWGFTFTLTFLIMFIASLISISPKENRKYWEKPKRQ